MNRATPRTWAAVKAAYMGGEMTVREISEKYSISKSSIYNRIRIERWRCLHDSSHNFTSTISGLSNAPESQAADVFTARLHNIVERSLAEVEFSLLDAGQRDSQDRARDVRTLTALVGIFEKLTDCAPTEDKPKDANQIEQDEDRMRAEIAGRLDRLRRIRNRETSGSEKW